MLSIYDISNHHTLLNLSNPIHLPKTTNNNNNNKNPIFNNQYNNNKSAITHHNNNSNINMHIMSIRLKLLALYMIA